MKQRIIKFKLQSYREIILTCSKIRFEKISQLIASGQSTIINIPPPTTLRKWFGKNPQFVYFFIGIGRRQNDEREQCIIQQNEVIEGANSQIYELQKYLITNILKSCQQIKGNRKKIITMKKKRLIGKINNIDKKHEFRQQNQKNELFIADDQSFIQVMERSQNCMEKIDEMAFFDANNFIKIYINNEIFLLYLLKIKRV